MAKDTAKRNAKKNAARIQNFRVITLSLLAISIAFYWMYDGFPGWRGWMLFAFWFSQEWYAISLLAARGAPATDPSTGDIVDCVDLSEVEQAGVFLVRTGLPVGVLVRAAVERSVFCVVRAVVQRGAHVRTMEGLVHCALATLIDVLCSQLFTDTAKQGGG